MSSRWLLLLLLFAGLVVALGGNVVVQDTLTVTFSFTDRAYNYGEILTVDVTVLNDTTPMTGLTANITAGEAKNNFTMTNLGAGVYRGNYVIDESPFTFEYNFTNETFEGYANDTIEVTPVLNVSLATPATYTENLNSTFTVTVTSIGGTAIQNANLTFNDSIQDYHLAGITDASGQFTFQYNQTEAGKHSLLVNATWIQNSGDLNHTYVVDGYYTTVLNFENEFCSDTVCTFNRGERINISLTVAYPNGTPVLGISDNVTVEGMRDSIIELSGTTLRTGFGNVSQSDGAGIKDVVFDYTDSDGLSAYANISLNVSGRLAVTISGATTADNASTPSYEIEVRDIHGNLVNGSYVTFSGASSGCTDIRTVFGKAYCTVSFERDETRTLTATATYRGNTGTDTHAIVILSHTPGTASTYGTFLLPPEFKFDSYPEAIITEVGKEQIVTFVLENTGNYDSDWSTVKFSFIPPDWYSARALNIPAGQKRDILVRIYIPPGTESKTYESVPATIWASSCGSMTVAVNETTYEPGQCASTNVKFIVKATGEVVESEAWAGVSSAIDNQTVLLELITDLESMDVDSEFSVNMEEGSQKLAEARDAYARGEYKSAKALADEAALILSRATKEAELLVVQELDPLILTVDSLISRLNNKVGDNQVNVNEATTLLASAREKIAHREYASAMRDLESARILMKDLTPIEEEGEETFPIGDLLTRLLAVFIITPLIVLAYLKRDEMMDLFSPVPPLLSKYVWPTVVMPNQRSDVSVSLSLKNSHLGQLTNVVITENLPLGFDYKEGSDSITNRKERATVKRTMNGSELTWSFPSLNATEAFVVTYKFAFTPVGTKVRLPGTKYSFTDSTGKTQSSHTSYKIIHVGYND